MFTIKLDDSDLVWVDDPKLDIGKEVEIQAETGQEVYWDRAWSGSPIKVKITAQNCFSSSLRIH